MRVTTTESARVSVELWLAGDPVGSGWTTDASPSGTSHVIDVWGLAPATRYNYRIHVQPSLGAAYTYNNRLGFTSGALPLTLPAVSVSASATPDFDYLMLDT